MTAPLVFAMLQAATVIAPAAGGTDCAAPGGNEIVVCGHALDPNRYRLPLRGADRPSETGPPRAEWSLGGGVRAGASVQSNALPQGAVSKRVMATVKIGF